jgi:hypothetical protein
MAQSTTGTITGTVSDPAKALVAGAPVEAKNKDNGVTYKAATSGTGNYTITELPAGIYDISVSAPGFKKEVETGVNVQALTTTRLDLTLQVGQTNETVTVVDVAPDLKTESSEISHNVTTASLDALPILTIGSDGAGVRNPLAALQLLPGASFASDATLEINGMPSSSQAIRIEGQDATNGFWKEINSTNQTGVDAIQEIVVETSNYAAEYGQAGGGYINYTMKSGTNKYHGGLFDYFANEAFNSGSANTNAGVTNSLHDGQHVRPRLRREDWGGTIGGPIRLGKLYNGTNKTFFFFSIEGYDTNNLVVGATTTVPTPAYQSGNFASILGPPLTIAGQTQVDALGTTLLQNQLFDPNTTRQVNGEFVRTPFPGNAIPINELDPTALKIQAMLPQPNAANPAALINNYTIPSYTNYTHVELPTLKLDHNVSPTIKISAFYSAQRQFSPANNGFTQAFSATEPTNNLSQTTRLNYDQTITPTLLMHIGAGLLETTEWNIPKYGYNQSQLFGNDVFPLSTYFPGITPGSGAYGGSSVAMGEGLIALPQKDTKPTFVNSFTWVKGNHTYKFGGEMIFEGLPIVSGYRAAGIIGFGSQETADPYSTGLTFANGNTGYSYASFLTGNYNSLNVAGLDDARLGNHSFGLYAQDSWKVSRKLTLDYGLRYDYATLLAEEHGRMQDAAFNLPNAAVGGRDGTVVYGGNCSSVPGCHGLNTNYPYALGPRLGLAYSLDKKTVIRLGAGITYGTSSNNAYLTYSVPDFYTYADQPVAGVAAGQLKYGNPFAPGNPLGNAPIVWPNFTPQYPFQQAPGYAPPESPFISIDRHAGRLPRQIQWSLGIQREVMRGLVVEGAFVGNVGVWWTAPEMALPNLNGITLPQAAAAGINTSSSTSLNLLTTPITSTLVQQAFPNLQIETLPNGFKVVPSVYSSFPATQTLMQALRPQPQWDGVPPFLGPPLGQTWYDSFQGKVTKRFSHGLTANYVFTWQKGLVNGSGSDTSYFVPEDPRINDPYNYSQNKQLNTLTRPLVSVISFTYQTPRLHGDGTLAKDFSWITKEWTLAGLATYQSGALIPTPSSNNNLLPQLEGAGNNPGLWGGETTMMNMVPGQSLFANGITPNCGCFQQTSQLVLNPNAWVDAPAGKYGTAPAYINSYRWQRQPSESASFGRIFPLSKEEKVKLQIRLEFTSNLFNRYFYSQPSASNPSATTLYNNPFLPGQTQLGALSSGFGFSNSYNGAGQQTRQGQIVARLTF